MAFIKPRKKIRTLKEATAQIEQLQYELSMVAETTMSLIHDFTHHIEGYNTVLDILEEEGIITIRRYEEEVAEEEAKKKPNHLRVVH